MPDWSASLDLSLSEEREIEALLRGEDDVQALLPGPSVHEFVPTLARAYRAPRHLDPLVRELERAWVEPVRVTAHAPPRHAKTDTVLGWIALTLRRQPHRTIAYVTYEDRTAQSKSRKARNWARAAGVQLAPDASTLNEWRTVHGGGVLATGIGGPLTSQGVDILVIDDPYKNRVQAESAAYRAMVADWWGDVAETRIEPGGSAFIFHTRWVEDDLIGHVRRGEDAGSWRHVHMPAIDAQGRALWAERWPVSLLEQKRRSVGEYTWASLFQGTPRARGGKLFQAPHRYDRLPNHYSEAIGVDLAYSKKTHADRSIAVVLVESGGRWYLTGLRRRQVKAPEFADELVKLSEAHPDAPFRWYCSGTEIGSASFIQARGVPLDARTTTADKFIRAQPVAAAWNAGRVLLPKTPPTGMSQEDLSEFVRVVTGFTGINDTEDDDVDALAAAFDLLPETAERAPKPQPGTAEWYEEQEAEAERRALAALGERDDGADAWPEEWSR